MQGGSFTQRRKDAKEESGLTWRPVLLVFFASWRLERSGRETQAISSGEGKSCCIGSCL